MKIKNFKKKFFISYKKPPEFWLHESKKGHLSNQKKCIYRIKKDTFVSCNHYSTNQKKYSDQLYNLMNQKSPRCESKTIYLHQ